MTNLGKLILPKMVLVVKRCFQTWERSNCHCTFCTPVTEACHGQ